MKNLFQIREKLTTDNTWIADVATKLWGSIKIISKNHIYNILDLPSFTIVSNGKPCGFIAYAKERDETEIVALYSASEKQGFGTALIERVKNIAKQNKCQSVWLMTTNDNTQALRFYQKRGFFIKAIWINTIEEQRKIKPTIPLLGNDGIQIRDEIELAMYL
jgi:ribosomal protein S18 acetylase RimI-like enzyme